MIRIIGVGKYRCSASSLEIEGVEAVFEGQLGVVRLCWHDFRIRAMKMSGRPFILDEQGTSTRTAGATMAGAMEFIVACPGKCQECKKVGGGVRFRLSGSAFGSESECFLCWEHFRLNTDVLMESGILRRHPRDLYDWVPMGAEERDRSGSTNTRSVGRGTSQTTSKVATENRSERVSDGEARSTMRSEGETDGHR